MKLFRLALLLLAFFGLVVGGVDAHSLSDGTQIAVMGGFPGRMGPLPQAQAYTNSETGTLIAAMTNAPTPARATIIDSTITSLKSSGAWAKKRAIYFLAAADAQAASLNWKSPGSNTITVVTGTPTFTADSGYTFNNTNALDTNFNPSGGGISLNSESLSVYILNNVAANTFALGTSQTAIIPRRSSGDNVSGFSQNNTSTTGTAGTYSTSVGLTAFDRSGSTGFTVYKNGTSIETLSRASVSVDTSDLFIGGKNNGAGSLGTSAGAHLISYVSMGDSLTSGENSGEYSAVSAYMTAVGAQ